ncbi:MAG: helix-turn-helix domain-containing protein [Candidatus Limnocylindrales bacterium]
MAKCPEVDGSVLLLGDWLARWRRAVGVSQHVLAARAGIDQSGLSRVERGLQVVGARRLARIIDTLDQLGEQRFLGPIAPPPFRRKDTDWP